MLNKDGEILCQCRFCATSTPSTSTIVFRGFPGGLHKPVHSQHLNIFLVLALIYFTA